MNPKSYAALFTVVVFVLAFVYATYTIPTEIALGAIPNTVDPRLWVFSLTYGVTAAVVAILALLAYRASRPLVGAGRHVMEYFALALVFYMLGAAATSIGLGSFIATGMSFNPAVWYVPSFAHCAPMAVMFAGIAPYFMLKFSYWMAEQKDPGRVREASVLAPLSILLLVTVSPMNWFGMHAPRFSLLDMQLKAYLLGILDPCPSLSLEVYPDIGIFSDGLLLLINLVAITQVIIFLRGKASSEKDPVRATRIKTVVLGIIMLLVFFLFNVFDTLAGGLTVLLLIGFVFMITAVVLLYLGVVTPEWYASWLQKRAKRAKS
ncbi:MAG: hypothetical protein QXN15_06680 [Candidatus Jordarchaeales archaeon]|nr:hypothetical protein [Candidatus Jordarchaeia archaeon]